LQLAACRLQPEALSLYLWPYYAPVAPAFFAVSSGWKLTTN
jgi:hypothetical protein